MRMKKVCVVGLGYSGLPTALLAAQAGLEVVGVDCNKTHLEAIRMGTWAVGDPEIVEQLQRAIATHNFTVSESALSSYYFFF